MGTQAPCVPRRGTGRPRDEGHCKLRARPVPMSPLFSLAGLEFHASVWARQSPASLDLPCPCPAFPSSRPLMGMHIRAGAARGRISLSPTAFWRARDAWARWDSQAWLRGHTGCFGQMLAPGHLSPPCWAPAPLAQLPGALEIIHRNVPFSSDWLLVTS